MNVNISRSTGECSKEVSRLAEVSRLGKSTAAMLDGDQLDAFQSSVHLTEERLGRFALLVHVLEVAAAARR